TKKSNELQAHVYSYLFKLPTTGLRFFTVYGPWGRPDMAPILFAQGISKGEDIKVNNNGEMFRDFTYIDDIVEGVYRSSLTIPNGEIPYEIMNIGNGSPVYLMDFIKAIEENLNKKAKIKFLPMQPGDVKTTYADTS